MRQKGKVFQQENWFNLHLKACSGDLRVRKEQWPLQRPKSDSPEQREPHCSWHGAHQSEGADHQPKGEQQQAQDLNPLGWESCLLPAKSKERSVPEVTAILE